MEEIWKVISNSDGHYYISNFGRMKRDNYICFDSLGKRLVRKAKTWNVGGFNKKNGYYSYRYRGKHGETVKQYVHRLVGFHFIHNPNTDEYNQINHIDGNKANNIYTNLEWVNGKLNMEHASKHNLINRDSEIRKKQAPINAVKGVEKIKKIWCKYDKEGNLVDVIKGKASWKCVQINPFRLHLA